MTLLHLLWIPLAVFTVLFIRAGYPQSTKTAFWLKMCASSVFLLHGILAYRLVQGGAAYGRWVLAALTLGWFGDIFLTIQPFLPPGSSRKTIALFTLPGGIAFFLGHAAYVVAFTRLEGAHAFSAPVFFAVWAGLTAVLIACKFLLRVDLQRLWLPILIYALAVTAMASFACTVALRGYSGISALLLIVSPLLFVLSDSTLGLRTFCPDRFRSIGVRALFIASYYIAQMLFGLSILYLPS